MSLSTLRRRLKHYGLKRKTGDEVNNDELTEIIRKEIDGPSCVSGYRALWHTLRLKYGICVPRARVQVLLKEINPDGTEQRKRHGLKEGLTNHLDPISVGMSTAMTNSSLMDSQYMAL